VEVVFSFDTTGSMAACIAEVRKKLTETAERLIKDIPKIRIGFIAHGDYCDYGTYVLEKIDLTNDIKALKAWIHRVGNTGGGDAPEAYEYALREARNFSWTPEASKAFVVIGDCDPHPPSYTTLKINWWDELDALIDLGVKVYGVRALDYEEACPFYEELSERSGAVSIRFKHFHLIVDMFLAICYRESSQEKLQKFQEEVETKAGGKVSEEMGQIFETLAQPNPEIKKDQKRGTRACTSPWYDISKDSGSPQYQWNESTQKWGPYNH